MFKKIKYIIALALLPLSVFSVESPKGETMQIVHKEKSLYRDINILVSDKSRCMAFISKGHFKMQGCERIKTPNALILPYSKLLLASLYLNPQPKKILVIGLGIGTMAKAFAVLYPNANIDVVEIDPAVFKLAQQYFDFKETEHTHVFIDDGRMYVKRAVKKGLQYDLIVLDAFNSDYIPEHLMTKEFLEEVKKILTPSGVVAANTFSASGLYSNESVTHEAVFGKFYFLKADNRIILEQKNGVPPFETVVANSVALEEKLNQFNVGRNWLLPLFSNKPDWSADARVLTDQYSPANLLNAQKP